MARRLGSPTKVHRQRAVSRVAEVESQSRLARTGSCGLRLTSLTAAYEAWGATRAHAGAGGKVAKGALSPKTVSADEMRRVYAAGESLQVASDDYRRDCVVGGKGR